MNRDGRVEGDMSMPLGLISVWGYQPTVDTCRYMSITCRLHANTGRYGPITGRYRQRLAFGEGSGRSLGSPSSADQGGGVYSLVTSGKAAWEIAER